jgi:hypothetical protein
LVDNPRLVNHISALERRTAAESFDHSPGAYDDVVAGLAQCAMVPTHD